MEEREGGPSRRLARANLLEGLHGDGRGRLLLALAVGWFFLIGVRLTVPALLPFIRAEYGLGLTAAGLLVSLLYGTYAVSQFPGGLLGDVLGERAVLVLAVGLSTAAVALLALPLAFPAFALAIVLFGIGSALYSPTRLTVLSDTFPGRDGTAIGITLAAGNAGNMTLPAAAGLLAGVLGWRAGFGLALPFLLAVAVALWISVPARTSEPMRLGAGPREVIGRLRAAVATRRVLAVAGLLLLIEFIWGAVTGIYPTYLVAEKGLPEGVAAVLFGLFFGVGIVVTVLAGYAGDRLGARRALVGLFGVAIAAFLAVTVVEGLAALVAVTIALSFLLGGAPIVFPYLNAELAADVQGSGLGLIRTVYMALGASGPAVMAALGDRASLDIGFYLLAGLALVAIAMAVTLLGSR